jgi:N-acetylmuramoyl-L-alanine amidase
MLIADRNQLREISARGPSLRVLSNKAKIADIQHVLLDADDAGLIGNPPPQRGQHMANATLEIARHVRNRLLAKGIKVTMTRENAERVPMAVRVSKARDTPADLLLTLSISEVESPEVSGLRAFYPSDVVDSVFSRTIDRSADEPLPASQVYRPFQARSQALASAMLQSVRPTLSQNATMGGGSAPAPLYLARRAPMPAINLVLGYMTNPADSARLSTPALQQELGYAIADALLELSGQGASGPSTTNTAPQDRTAGETPNE